MTGDDLNSLVQVWGTRAFEFWAPPWFKSIRGKHYFAYLTITVRGVDIYQEVPKKEVPPVQRRLFRNGKINV